jgi:hypothetical protein
VRAATARKANQVQLVAASTNRWHGRHRNRTHLQSNSELTADDKCCWQRSQLHTLLLLLAVFTSVVGSRSALMRLGVLFTASATLPLTPARRFLGCSRKHKHTTSSSRQSVHLHSG